MNTTAFAAYFGEKNAPPIRTMFDLMDVSRQGLPKKAIANMADYLTITLPDLFTILHISARTWQRYPADKPMPQAVTEKALQLAHLYARGHDLFGDAGRFSGWMNHPSLVLRGKKPLDLLDTDFGFQAVTDELIRIEHGVLA